MNPFDQFAANLNDALPPQQQQQQQHPPPPGGTLLSDQQQQHVQFNLMAPPAPERKPIMNLPGGGMVPQQQQQPLAPMMMYGQQPPPPPAFSGSMTSYGGQPPPFQGMPAGSAAPPHSQQGMTQYWPSSSSSSMVGALVPSTMPSNPYALNNVVTAAENPFLFAGGPSSLSQQQQPPVPIPEQQSIIADPFGFDSSSSPMRPPQQQQSPPPSTIHQQFGNTTTPMMGMAPMDPVFGMTPTTSSQQQQQQMPPPPQQYPLQQQQQQQLPPYPQQQQQQQSQQSLSMDPWGGGFDGGMQQPHHHQQQQPSMALVPASIPSEDPFGIFGSSLVPSTVTNSYIDANVPSVASSYNMPPQMTTTTTTTTEDDPWAQMGFGPSSVGPPNPLPHTSGVSETTTTTAAAALEDDLFNATLQPTHDTTTSLPTSSSSSSPRKDSKRKKGELPPGGEWYDAKIFTPTLGVMFFKPKELLDSLFLQTDKKLVDALDERPVVAFIVEGSSARSAGVELGHVLLKVNGIDVKNPKEASRLIKEGPRPLPLLFYVPETSVVVSEGEHMVKYNTKDTSAPNSAKDWKPKYVVVGGIIAQPWIMNMYRSKSEYDIAVIETQARRPISVKVKQFSLQGARIQNDWQGPQMVKYKNKLHPWKYIVVLPVARNPIKIGAPNLSQLKPVHEGIRRVLQVQQQQRTPAPVMGPSDPYRSGGGGGGGGGYDGRDQNGHDAQRDRTTGNPSYSGGY